MKRQETNRRAWPRSINRAAAIALLAATAAYANNGDEPAGQDDPTVPVRDFDHHSGLGTPGIAGEAGVVRYDFDCLDCVVDAQVIVDGEVAVTPNSEDATTFEEAIETGDSDRYAQLDGLFSFHDEETGETVAASFRHYVLVDNGVPTEVPFVEYACGSGLATCHAADDDVSVELDLSGGDATEDAEDAAQ